MAQSSDMLVVSEVEIETILRRWGVYWALLYIVYYRRSVTIREEIKSMEQEAQHFYPTTTDLSIVSVFYLLRSVACVPSGCQTVADDGGETREADRHPIHWKPKGRVRDGRQITTCQNPLRP